MSMNYRGQHLVGSPSWSSATHSQEGVGMDYRMGLIVDHGLPRVDLPLRRLAQAHSQTDLRALSASPRPRPTPTSAISIPMPPATTITAEAPMGYDHHPLQASAQGLPPVQDEALNNMHSTSVLGPVDHPDLDLSMDRMMIVSPGLGGGQAQVSSYRRSTYPLLPQTHHHNLHSPADMMHTDMDGLGAGGMGMVGMGWQVPLPPIKAESPPPDRLHLD